MAGEVAHELDEQSWLYRPSFPDEWKRISLLSMARWVNGLVFRDFQFSDTGKPIIKIAEIKGGITGQTKFTNQAFEESIFVTNGNMLFSWSGQPETSIDVFWWRGRDGWLNQHIFKVTPIEELDPVFFFYVLRYLKPNFIGIARNKQTTGLGHVTRRDIENIEAAFPPVAEQKAIAAVLGALDDKIELNRRMNATLEAMARALFQSWFVDFDPVRAKLDGRKPIGLDETTAALFPNSFQESSLGTIPHGWEVKTLGEVIELAYGKPLKAEDRKNGQVCVYGSNGSIGWHDEKLVAGPGIVVGRKGNPGVVTWAHGDFYPIDTTFYVEPIGACRSLHFFYYALSLQNLANLSADSAVPGLNRNHAYMSKQVIPSQPVLKAFDLQIAPIFASIHSNEEHSRTLATLRDTLLPKLLSGELTINGN